MSTNMRRERQAGQSHAAWTHCYYLMVETVELPFEDPTTRGKPTEKAEERVSQAHPYGGQDHLVVPLAALLLSHV